MTTQRLYGEHESPTSGNVYALDPCYDGYLRLIGAVMEPWRNQPRAWDEWGAQFWCEVLNLNRQYMKRLAGQRKE